MIDQGRRISILSTLLIAALALGVIDRFILMRNIRYEHWRAKEELAEKEVKLKITQDLLDKEQKELDKLRMQIAEENRKEEALSGASVGQPLFDLNGPPPREEELQGEVSSLQEEAIEKELTEMERKYKEWEMQE